MSSMLSFQDSASPLMEQLIYFHDLIMVILSLIMFLVGSAMLLICLNKNSMRILVEGQKIESVWTMVPVILLLMIGFPSLQVLYLMDDPLNFNLSMKATGHQWYWSYEFSDFESVEYDSYMLLCNEEKLVNRLLDVDNSVVLPYSVDIRVLMTAYDVIHAWTVPALGLKCDCIPGRLNQMVFNINRPGVFYGQCSEVCGANHSFMPIKVESVPMNVFIDWIGSFK